MVSMRGTRQPGNHLAAIQKQTMANTALQPFKTLWKMGLRIRSLFNSVGLAAMDGNMLHPTIQRQSFFAIARYLILIIIWSLHKNDSIYIYRGSLQGNRLLKTQWHEGVKKEKKHCMHEQHRFGEEERKR